MLRPEIQQYILSHEQADENALVLKHTTIHGCRTAEVAVQIAARRKAKVKFPLFYHAKNILYPPSVNLEQSSSEATARFKASLFSGAAVADLTGGFGVDTFFLSQRFCTTCYVEPDHSLFEIARHNHTMLGASTIQHIHSTAENFLNTTSIIPDLLYLDPSRRNPSSKKVFRFADCQPNVISLLPFLLKIPKTLIKASPWLDISLAIKDLVRVDKVLVVAVGNECKEVLFCLSPDAPDTPVIEAVDLRADGTIRHNLSFSREEEREADVRYADPRQYIYEPSAAISKAGAFKIVASRFGLDKLSANTHLYTSDNIIADFPGKIFRVLEWIKPERKLMPFLLPENKANITTRNYPLTADQLRKRLQLEAGGDQFILGFGGLKKNYLALAIRVS